MPLDYAQLGPRILALGLGKRRLGLRVIEAQGRPLTPARGAVRLLLKLVPFTLPFFFGRWGLAALALHVLVSAAGIYFHRRRQTWYDLVARTLVFRPPAP